jgi:hypothetical protein
MHRCVQRAVKKNNGYFRSRMAIAKNANRARELLADLGF